MTALPAGLYNVGACPCEEAPVGKPAFPGCAYIRSPGVCWEVGGVDYDMEQFI